MIQSNILAFTFADVWMSCSSSLMEVITGITQRGCSLFPCRHRPENILNNKKSPCQRFSLSLICLLVALEKGWFCVRACVGPLWSEYVLVSFYWYRNIKMRLKELTEKPTNRIVAWHRSGRGYKNSVVLKFLKSRVAPKMLKWKKFQRTRTLPRTSHPGKLSIRGRIKLSRLIRSKSNFWA